MKRIKNLPLVIALLLIAVAGFGFFSIIQGLQNNVSVLVAKEQLAAYTYVTKSDFVTKDIPQSAVTDDMLTEDEYNSRFLDSDTGKDKGTVLTYPFLAGQYIVNQGISDDPQSTFAVVNDNERIVTVSASVTGVGLGTIRPGDVVTVTPSSSAGYSSAAFSPVEYVKVLCITTSFDGCRNVLPPSGADSADTTANPTDPTSSSSVYYLLLAVPEADASSLAGQDVALTQDPFCRVGAAGQFIGDRCQAPGSEATSLGNTSDGGSAADAGGSTTTTPATGTETTPSGGN